MRVLVTGGAGFIGSHITDELIARGHRVTVLDILHPQIHPSGKKPGYLTPRAEFIRGDVRDRTLMSRLVRRVDAIVHQAAIVGVGQSMYQVEEYVDINVRGTAALLEVLASGRHKVKKIVVASSMSIYGEGAYRCPRCGESEFLDREPSDLKRGRYDPVCRAHRSKLAFQRTPETKSIVPTSIYALTKRDQEEMFLMMGKAYGIAAVAFRYFNVYGPRQALSNPYTGVLAIFGSRLLNNHAPLIFEDGLQSRDFVHVRDVALANALAVERSGGDGRALNVGSGDPRTIIGIARDLAALMDKNIRPKLLGDYRVGDIRHCIADNRAIRAALGWSPRVTWESGLAEYAAYLQRQTAVDRVAGALKELKKHRLSRRSRRV